MHGLQKVWCRGWQPFTTDLWLVTLYYCSLWLSHCHGLPVSYCLLPQPSLLFVEGCPLTSLMQFVLKNVPPKSFERNGLGQLICGWWWTEAAGGGRGGCIREQGQLGQQQAIGLPLVKGKTQTGSELCGLDPISAAWIWLRLPTPFLMHLQCNYYGPDPLFL